MIWTFIIDLCMMCLLFVSSDYLFYEGITKLQYELLNEVLLEYKFITVLKY